MDLNQSSSSSSQQSSSSLSQQSNLSQHRPEISLNSYRKLQETVQHLLKNQDSLIIACSKQKTDLKKLKELVKSKDEEYKQFCNLVFPFFDKYAWEEVTIDKVCLIQNHEF